MIKTLTGNAGAVFQHTAARRRLDADFKAFEFAESVSTHSRPKAAGGTLPEDLKLSDVSTHSRPKAAGIWSSHLNSVSTCFNTQPPEGGWYLTQFKGKKALLVSTHSRPKAAG